MQYNLLCATTTSGLIGPTNIEEVIRGYLQHVEAFCAKTQISNKHLLQFAKLKFSFDTLSETQKTQLYDRQWGKQLESQQNVFLLHDRED